MAAASVNLTYWNEFTRQLFFLTSAGLGALFAVLYPITAATSAGTYDENDDASYIARLVVGLISGTILGQLITVNSIGSLGGLSRPALAVLGGFSASLVFKILTGIVHGAESVFAQDGREVSETVGASARDDLRVLSERYAVVRNLADLQASCSPQSAQFQALDALIDRVLRGDLAP